MTKVPSTVAFVWQSQSLTGAQRRMLSLAHVLNANGQRAIVILESRDAQALAHLLGGLPPFVKCFTLPKWLHAAGRGRGKIRRLWWHSGLRYFYHAGMKRELQTLKKLENVKLWHVCMSAELAHCTNGPALFEVTSPDWADTLANGYAILPAGMPLHAVSRSVAERLRDKLSGHSIVEAPLLFPNVDPAASPAPAADAKEKLIVFAHRLIPRKNGVLFARAVRKFLGRRTEWRVAIRGDGPDDAIIRQILAEEISNGRVNYGYTSELMEELRRASIFVSIISPDNYPSQGIVEAMIAGNALLLSDLGQTREKFLDGNGITTMIDEDEVLASLIEMTRDTEELARMGRRSFNLASERFSQQAYLQHLGEVYQSCGLNSNAFALCLKRASCGPSDASKQGLLSNDR